jgi:hypothetical protein
MGLLVLGRGSKADKNLEIVVLRHELAVAPPPEHDIEVSKIKR